MKSNPSILGIRRFDHVRVDSSERLQPLLPVAGFVDFKVAVEGHAVERPPGRIIVYDQHLHHRLPLLGRGSAQRECQGVKSNDPRT